MLIMDEKTADNAHLAGQKINLHSDENIRYWCRELNCNQDDLIQSVLRIGNSAKMVDDFLILNRKKNYKP